MPAGGRYDPVMSEKPEGPLGPALREADRSDLEPLVALVNSAYRGDASRAGWTTEADLLDGQRIDAEMLSEAMADPSVVVLVAVVGGRWLGCCEVRRSEFGGSGTAAANLGMFAVDPATQGQGIGTAVLRHAEDDVTTRWGSSVMELAVLEGRTELLQWYERQGYECTGRTRAFPYGDERFGVPLRDDLHFVVLAKPL